MAAPRYRTTAGHPQLRSHLLATLKPGTPCPQTVNGLRCGQPMYATQPLDLGHAPDGTYLGLVHARCNRQDGAIRRNRGITHRPIRRIAPRGRRW